MMSPTLVSDGLAVELSTKFRDISPNEGSLQLLCPSAIKCKSTGRLGAIAEYCENFCEI